MSTTVEIGDRLRAERQRCRLTQVELAALTHVSKTTQLNYESSLRAPDALYLAAAAAAGLDINYIVTGQSSTGTAPEKFAVIPLLGAVASAGNGTVNEPHAEYTVDGLCFSLGWLQSRGLKPATLRVIVVRGASMDGVLSDGDRVLIDMSDTEPRSGFVYVIRQGAELLVKYCQLLPGGVLRVSSANPSYQAYDVDLARTPDVAIVGRVVASMHQW